MKDNSLAQFPESFGCDAFGHLASPYVDGELRGAEVERFGTHLPTCEPCLRLIAEYRAVDALGSRTVPLPTAEQWDVAWQRIRAQGAADREAAASSLLAPVFNFVRPAADFVGRSRLLRPLSYAAAASLLVALLLAVQRSATTHVPKGEVITLHEEPAKVLSIACASPDYMPVVYSSGDGDGAVTVVQCAYVGTDT